MFHLWPDQVSTTGEVLSEYQAAAQAGHLPAQAWSDLPVADMTPREIAIAESFSTRLGAGERSCLAVAHTRGGLLATDDADARAAAKRLGVPVTGTIGILVLAVRRELLTLRQANTLLTEMIAAGYRSPLEKLDTLV
ncbi:MAG: DUF3368 domain-containing protein [Anaerolineae bacterium]|nr:DUF3368 domain-containing protein [Anaerolineae bacterium]